MDAGLAQRCFHEIGHAVVGLRTGQTLLYVRVDPAGAGRLNGAAFERARPADPAASLHYCARLYGGREAVSLAVGAGLLPAATDADLGFVGAHPDCDERRIAAEIERAALVWDLVPEEALDRARQTARSILRRHWRPVVQAARRLQACHALGACEIEELIVQGASGGDGRRPG